MIHFRCLCCSAECIEFSQQEGIYPGKGCWLWDVALPTGMATYNTYSFVNFRRTKSGCEAGVQHSPYFSGGLVFRV